MFRTSTFYFCQNYFHSIHHPLLTRLIPKRGWEIFHQLLVVNMEDSSWLNFDKLNEKSQKRFATMWTQSRKSIKCFHSYHIDERNWNSLRGEKNFQLELWIFIGNRVEMLERKLWEGNRSEKPRFIEWKIIKWKIFREKVETCLEEIFREGWRFNAKSIHLEMSLFCQCRILKLFSDQILKKLTQITNFITS